MILKIGSKGKLVKLLQEFLNIKVDGDFGPKTKTAVIKWQNKNGLLGDGIVGSKTWDKMGLATTDFSELIIQNDGLEIKRHFLPSDEYKHGPTKKEYLFLHHTAGWHNPYNQIDQWANDFRGSIGTEFVIGGPSVKGNDNKYDGEVLHAIPEGGYGWHLGNNGSQYMHTHSVGVEVCNFGYLENGKTYSGTHVVDSQRVNLKEPFRGHLTWHKYSNEQINSLKELILYIANRDSINIHDGLIKEIKKFGVGGFEFNEDAYYGRTKSLWTHTNTREDKFDMFPQQELIDMLLSL